MLSKKPGPRTRCTSTQACRTDDATASTSPAGSSKFLASLASWRSIPSHRLAHAKRCGLAASSAALADGFPAGNRSNPLRRGTSSFAGDPVVDVVARALHEHAAMRPDNTGGDSRLVDRRMVRSHLVLAPDAGRECDY